MDNSLKIKQYLLPNETLLWQGFSYGKHKILSKSRSVMQIVFGALFIGFAVFFIMASKAGGIFFLFGLPFIFIGIYFAFGQNIIKSNRLKNCMYAVTDKRIIIIYKDRVTSKELESLPEINLIMGERGHGWIFFDGGAYGEELNNGYYRYDNRYNRNSQIAFEDINNADVVYKTILVARENIKSKQ
ncbi:MAG: hypothetical protein RR316_02785 [Clostridia bacterium]